MAADVDDGTPVMSTCKPLHYVHYLSRLTEHFISYPSPEADTMDIWDDLMITRSSILDNLALVKEHDMVIQAFICA